MLSGLGNSELVSVDVDGGTSRSIVIEGPSPAVADVAGDRALLVAPSGVAPSSFDLGVADFTSGIIAPIGIPQLGASSMRVTGGGLSPDGAQVALILADQEDPDGHLLLVADIAADGSVGPLTVLATGPEFAPNDGDLTIKPAGLGRLGEIAWTKPMPLSSTASAPTRSSRSRCSDHPAGGCSTDWLERRRSNRFTRIDLVPLASFSDVNARPALVDRRADVRSSVTRMG